METRTIPELLQVLLDNEDLFKGGLCVLTNTLYNRDIITVEEMDLLNGFLSESLPTATYSNNLLRYPTHRYCFPYGQWQPRKEWLQKQIEYSKNFES